MKIAYYLLGYLIYPFSFLFPRSKRIWVFGSFRGSFNDNAKYLFIYASENKPDITSIWLSQNKNTVSLVRQLGLKSYSIFSLKGIFYSLRAKYWFYNSYTSDILFFTSGGSTCTNLWHGVGLKKIEFSIKSGALSDIYVKNTFKQRFFYPQVFRRPDYFLSSTEFQSIKFAEAFRINVSKCLNLGYPRNELLIETESERMQFVERYEPVETKEIIEKIKSFNKAFIYMPTWRDSQKDLFSQTFDLQYLNEIMFDKKSLLILKPHANTTIDSRKLSMYSNIMVINNKVDIYTILPYTNVLITDYSSVLYDYILMKDKDIILYLYDYNEYINTRDFNYPFHENVVGKCVSNFSELVQCIKDEDYRIDEAKRLEIKNRFWGNQANNICEEIISRVTL